jgi:iron(II)-dependent oxidoreductase
MEMVRIDDWPYNECMSQPPASFRTAGPDQLAAALQNARHYTLALFDSLAAAGYDQPHQVPRLSTVNPPLWELGHTAWFAEWFVLREALSSHPAAAQKPGLLTRGDDWFDSGLVPHKSRWTLDLPSPGALKTYCREVLDRIFERLEREGLDDEALYPYRLVLAHEDMHGEAYLYTMQTLGVAPQPELAALLAQSQQSGTPAHARGEIAFAGGSFERGGDQARGFVFDNEKAGGPCRVAPFAIDAGPVTNASYLEFMDDGGYQRPAYWSDAGRNWLMGQERSSPRYWHRAGGDWRHTRFGRELALAPEEPVRHVTLFEAQAWCAWAGRRLPLEEEWEFAATSRQPGFSWGQLWEWTASRFAPYPGFAPDRYLDYSKPWFGSRQTLRGASFATPARLRSPQFRNFFTPERDDIYVGFRSCAL